MSTRVAEHAKDLRIEVDRALEHAEDMARVATYHDAWHDVRDQLEHAIDHLRATGSALDKFIAANDRPPF